MRTIMTSYYANINYDEEFADFTLIVKEKEFSVHRVILAARSPFFAKMFKSDMQEAADKRGELKDIEPDTFEEMLKFIYSGRLTATADHLAMDLFIAADLMQVEGLKEICVEKITKNLNKENALAVYDLADRFNVAETMKTRAWSIIQS